MNAVRWAPIAGWEGFYEVSDDGRVRSVDRVVLGRAGSMRWRGKHLKAGRVEGGYEHVTLSRPGLREEVSMHVAVALAFIGPCPDGMEVCHRDGTRTNNHWKNLRYGTRKSNAEDRVLHGTNHIPGNFGTANGMSVLNDDLVREIRRTSGSLKPLAERLGIHFSTLYLVRQRKTWNHVE